MELSVYTIVTFREFTSWYDYITQECDMEVVKALLRFVEYKSKHKPKEPQWSIM